MAETTDLKRLRSELRWTQGQMADFLGIARSSVAHMERGRAIRGPVRKLLANLPRPPAPAPTPEAVA